MNRRVVGIALLGIVLALSGCSYLPSWMGGKEEVKPKLPGERIAVLPVGTELQPDATLKDIAVSLPPAAENADWPQHSGAVTAAAGNLASKSGLTRQATAAAGDGEAFDHVLIPAPVTGGDTVFAMDAVGNISAHNAAHIGTIRWHSKGVSEKHTPEIMGGGLAFDQGKLYATSGRGIVAAFDAANGKTLWSKALRVPFRSAPRIADGRLFATTIDDQTFALNATSGEVLWSQRGISETAGLLNSIAPAISGDTVLVPYASGEIYALSASDGRELWSDSLSAGKHTQATAFFSGIGGDPVVDGDIVMAVGSGGVTSVFHVPSGQRVWERPIGGINMPWIAGDYLFILTGDNTVACLVKYNGRVRWATRLPDFKDQKEKKDPITWKGPVLVDGKLAVVGSHGQLWMISATDGKVASTKVIPEGVYTAPIVAAGRMYLITQDAQLVSLQ